MGYNWDSLVEFGMIIWGLEVKWQEWFQKTSNLANLETTNFKNLSLWVEDGEG